MQKTFGLKLTYIIDTTLGPSREVKLFVLCWF